MYNCIQLYSECEVKQLTGKTTRSLADLVFERIENAILDGTYAPGETLTEMRLSAELHVSRTPVREAIRRLEQERLVTESGKGIVVKGITIEDFLDVYEIRLRIEGLATRRCAERITDDQLATLRSTYELYRYYTERKIPDQIKDADTQFHELIYDFCGSDTLQETLSVLHKKVAKYRKLSVQNQDRASVALAEHLGILEALESRDADRAEQLAIAHVCAARDSIRSQNNRL